MGTGSEIHTMELDEFKNHLNDSSPRFQIIEGSFTWHEAKADAESRGGRLAVLDTEEKIQIVDKLIAESGFLGTWVGLTDEANEGDWRWINGQIVTANRWAQGQPDLEGSEDHAGYDYTSLHKGWHDMPSGWGLRYVLEDPLLHTLNTSPVLNGAITGSGEYEPGATATITATPNAGYIFSGWTGDASGTDNPLSLTMDADKVIGATFEQDIADADSDGLSNYDEIVTYGSDPKNPDSDGDFLGDGFEVNNSSDPNVKTESQAYGLKIKSITKPSSFGNISNAKEIQLEGHTLAAWESSGNGNIHLFNFSEGKLTYQSSIASPDTSHDWPAFGAQMSLIGDRLVTGDPITWISGIHDGRGYQYNIQDRQNPQFEHRLDRDAQTATYIGGYVLAVNGFSILSSSGWSDFGTQNKVHIFRENGEFYQTWTDGYNKLIEFARSPSGDAFIVSRTESSSAPAAQATKIDIYNVTDGNIQHHGGPQLTFQFSYNDFSSINESGNQHSNHRFAFDGNKIYAIDDDYLRIFSLDDGTWNETSVDLRIYSGGSKFSSTNLLLGDGFLIVSSPNADCRDSSKGCVVIFDINSANGALRYRETIPNSSQIPGEFGSYVALDEKTGHLLVSTEFGSSHAWGVINSNDGNWIVYEGLKEKQSTFQIIEGSFTWHEAKADAEARGGRLAVLDTQEKIDQANAYLGGYDYWPDMWIGLTDEAQEGSWKWIDGSPLSSTNWYPGEPNDMYGEDFAILYRNLPGVHSNGEWNDVGDSFRTAYLLEHSQVENFDTDSDGYADAEEIQWGSNPNDSGSYPQVYVSFSSNGGGNIEATGLDYGNGWGNYWYNYYEGYAPLRSIVTLTPVAYNGYVFTGWFGDASGTSSPLNLQMDSSKSVQANFEPDYADTDGDGLTNYEELAIYITNPNASDTDDDGHSDAKEIQRGSDPNNSASIPEKLGNYIGSFDSISNKVYGGSSFLINLPAASSGLPVVVSVKSGPAKVEGNRVRLTGAGIVVLAANQPGDEDYKAANEVTVSFAVLDLQNMTGEYIGNFNAEYFEGAQEAMNRNGQLSMKLAKDGAFTGSMVILGSRISIRGKFDAYGAAEISVSSKTISGVFVDLSIEPMTETEFQVAASIRWSDETSSEFVCYPVAYTGTGGTNNCTLAGKQINSLLISQLLSGIDFGHGFTKIKISTNGTLTFAGRMADGSTVTGSSRLVKDEYGDLLAQASLPLAAVKGLLHGVAQVQTDPEEGQYHLASPYEWVWVRLPQSRARIFKEGFAEKLSVYGQVWNYTKGQSALPEGVDGFTFQVDPDSIVLEEPLDLWGSWPSSNKPTWDYMPKGFTFKVNPITGDISGTAPRTINGKATKAATYQGLLLRPGLETYDGSPLLGGGYILGAESSGVVELTVP
ncbi:MAG: hypothetical protein KJS91_09315 [Planctomycetes bacterium]|nr:hypothetical protein [Planctomycetota bacterium]